MAQTPRLAKGLNLLELAKFVRSQKAADTLPGLTSEDRELIKGRIMPTSWYPFETFVRVLCSAHATLMGGSDAAARQMGHLSCTVMLSGPHAVFVHAGNPAR